MRSNYDLTSDPTVPPSVSGVYPVRFVRGAMLMADGVTVVGYVPRPDDGWEPSDLIWTPPGVKMGPAEIGQVQDVWSGGSTFDWVRTQLDKRSRWVEMLRQRVLGGSLKLNPLTAKQFGKLLGLPDDAVALDELSVDRIDLYDIRANLPQPIHFH